MTNKEFEERVELVIQRIIWYAAMIAVGFALTMLGIALFSYLAFGQATTEVYIPIGQSPGLSQEGKTLVGLITEVRGRTLTVLPLLPLEVLHLNGTLTVPPSKPRQIRIPRSTMIYVDHSKIQRPNRRGTWDDLKPHRVVEVYKDQWVKVRVDE